MSLHGLLGLNQRVEHGQDIGCPETNSSFRLFFDRTILASIPPPPDNSTILIDRWGYESMKVVPNYGQVGISAGFAATARI